jgi:hypothetical protein
MDIQHPTRERVDDRRRNESQVSREGDQADVLTLEGVQSIARHVCGITTADRYVNSVDASATGSIECPGIRAVAHHEHDAGVCGMCETIEQSLKVGSTARREHGESRTHARPPP